jgi:hypothetical protein
VTWPACKCLFFKKFFSFEPQCSTFVKPVGMNDLARLSSKCNSFIPRWLFGAEFDTISTAGMIPDGVGQSS